MSQKQIVALGGKGAYGAFIKRNFCEGRMENKSETAFYVISAIFLVTMVAMYIFAFRNTKRNIPDSPKIRIVKWVTQTFELFGTPLVALLLLISAPIALLSGIGKLLSQNYGESIGIMGLAFLLFLFAERAIQFFADNVRGVVFDPDRKLVEFSGSGLKALKPFCTTRVVVPVQELRQISRWLEREVVVEKDIKTKHTHKLNIVTSNSTYSLKCSDDAKMDAVEQLFREAMQYQ